MIEVVPYFAKTVPHALISIVYSEIIFVINITEDVY